MDEFNKALMQAIADDPVLGTMPTSTMTVFDMPVDQISKESVSKIISDNMSGNLYACATHMQWYTGFTRLAGESSENIFQVVFHHICENSDQDWTAALIEARRTLYIGGLTAFIRNVVLMPEIKPALLTILPQTALDLLWE